MIVRSDGEFPTIHVGDDGDIDDDDDDDDVNDDNEGVRRVAGMARI